METSMFKFEKPKINPEQIPGRKDLIMFFKRHKMEKYLEVFPKTVSLSYFKTMNEEDFVEYGIREEEDLQILIKAVKTALQEEDQENEFNSSSSSERGSVSSPTTPTEQKNPFDEASPTLLGKPNFFARSTSYELSRMPNNNEEPVSNLVRMRNTLGNSDPSLSQSASDVCRKLSICGISPRRPRSLLPHSPSPPRALSPVNVSEKHSLSPSNSHAAIPINIHNASIRTGRRWSIASSGYSTNTSESRTSSQEKLMLLDDYVFGRQQSNDSTYSDVDDEIIRSPYRGRSRSLSPTRNENELSILSNIYKDRFPKAKQQMEENLKFFISENQTNTINEMYSDAAINFVSQQILEIAKTVLTISEDDSKNITSSFFYGITDSLDKLQHEVCSKTSSRDIEDVNRMIRNLLMILSRSSRLLECLEFNPSTYYNQLEIEEVKIAEQKVDVDMADYIKNKLGINDEKQQVEVEEERSRKTSIIPEPKEEDFQLVKIISNGAYGSVHLVRHVITKQRYAMKKMRKHHLLHKNQVQQVFTERDIMSFAQNPFVVTLVCTFETKKFLCMVMEYVEGGDCASLLKNIERMTEDLARHYFAETLLAVEYIHSYGIIHRDLKPDNLLITSLGHIKLTDFGLSKIGLMNVTTNICEQTTQQFNDTTLFGTPDYLPPEVILRKGYGKPVDYWALGVILYEFLIGVTPFYGETVEEVFDMALSGEIEWPEGDEVLPDDSVHLIKSLLVHEPSERLGTQGASQVKDHPWFVHVNWNYLLREKAEFVPVLDDEEDTSYFDTREDRYNHEYASDDEEDDDEEEVEHLGNFSTCSPRFSRIISDNQPPNDEKGVLSPPDTSKKNVITEVEDAPDGGDNNDGDNNSGDNTMISTSRHRSLTETDSGECSSLESSSSAASLLVLQHECRKKQEDQDTDTSPLLDISPRRYLSTASFTTQRVPSPKQPSPLVIDMSRNGDAPLQRTFSASSEPSTPLISHHQHYPANIQQQQQYHQKLQRTKSTPPCIGPSKAGAIPKLELSASEDEFIQRKPVRRRNTRSGSFHRRRTQTPPHSPTEKSLRRISSPVPGQRPVVLISRRNLSGFTMKVIRVYIGESTNYTINHLVQSVSEHSPAYEAGLRTNDLITHINSEPIQGLQHVEVVRIILQGSDTIKLSVTELENSSIRTGRKRRTVGHRVQTRSRSGSRSRTNSYDDPRTSGGKKPLFKRMRPKVSSLRRSSSLKRASKKAGLLLPPPTAEMESSPSTSPTSPKSPLARPAFLQGVLPKLTRPMTHSPRRRSISCIPVSPLALPPDGTETGQLGASPMATKSGGTLLSPTQPTAKKMALVVMQKSSPSRSGSSGGETPERMAPTRLEDLLSADGGLDMMPKRIVRSQSMKEPKRRRSKHYFKDR